MQLKYIFTLHRGVWNKNHFKIPLNLTSSTSYHFSFPLVSSLTRAAFNLTGAASNQTGASFNLTGAATSLTGAATSLIGAAPADTKPTKYYGAATDLTGAAPADTKPTMIEVEVDED